MATKTKEKPLTKKQAERVAVLKDALAQIKLGVYKSSDGVYVSTFSEEPEWVELLQAQQTLNQIGIKVKTDNLEVQKLLPGFINKNKPCKVCAKGALAISAIKKFNNLTVEELADNCSLDEIASNKAQEFFGEKNADLMEKFYEGWTIEDDFELNDIKDSWVSKYGSNSDEMLIAIYTNAIKNKGIFKPEQIK